MPDSTDSTDATPDHPADRATVRTIRVSALVLRRDDTMLMVRKRGTTAYMLPGGKPEPGEAPIDTIIREVDEELGLPLTREDLEELGTFEAPAANEADHQVIGDVFVHRGMPDGFDFDDIRPQAEIDSVAWFAPDALPEDSAALTIAPLTRDRVVPALARHGG
ncbi:NUDIX hydrolase [Brevibacterium yomogidense]|uniref:Nudix hydrolase family protein PA3470 n=1 Tax=Brevibacterium yomogidense TaxID=946573 RepID=A0A1X6X858_9MICO|nr:NUDIX domain-containing protein [Brevibacterium yomogidense]SLM95422.1 Nudix hydrolase family protein PA3470 [Brevibacterium yomogidense]